jgi:hypothetical protein
MNTKILEISLSLSTVLIIVSIFSIPHIIEAQDTSSNVTRNISPKSNQLEQIVYPDKISNSTYYTGENVVLLKTYERDGNPVIVHPGESYVSTAECNLHDVLIGGGVYSNHQFSNLTLVDMPNGFQKDEKKWLVNGVLSKDIGKNVGNEYCETKKWLVDGYVPKNGTTIEITPVAVCAIKN